MSFEDLQKAWQAQDLSGQVRINTGLLLTEVRRNQRQFWTMIFWRDVREVLVAVVLAGFFSFRGLRTGNWPDYLVALACAGIGAFLVADRVLERRKNSPPNHPLKGCIESSL